MASDVGFLCPSCGRFALARGGDRHLYCSSCGDNRYFNTDEELQRAEWISSRAARYMPVTPILGACIGVWLEFLREQTEHTCDPVAAMLRSFKEGDLDPVTTTFAEEPGLDNCGLRGTHQRRQQEALEAILAKMAEAGWDEVGMGKEELERISTMPQDSARHALDALVTQGWLERRKMPRMRENRQARLRRRARGRQSQYFYSLPEAIRIGLRTGRTRALEVAFGRASGEADEALSLALSEAFR